MERPEIALGEDEWKKLSVAGIEPEAFDDCSFEDILMALQPGPFREKELRVMFFGEPEVPGLSMGIDSVLQESLHQAYGMNDMITRAVTGPMSVVGSLIRPEAAGNLLSIASTVRTSLDGMNQLVSKPAWQVLHESLCGANESLKTAASWAINAASPLQNQMTGMSKAYELATWAQTNPYLISGSAASIAYIQKINSPIETFINKHGNITTLFDSMNPHEHTLAHSAVAGSLLDVNRYKNLGIAAIAEAFSINQLERNYATGILDTIKAATAFTRMGEENLSSFDWAMTGSRYDLSKSLVGPAQNGFLAFTANYRNVLESMSAKPNWLYEAPAVAKLPSLEYYTSSQILRLVSDEDVSVEEIAEETEKAAAGQSDYLLEYLPRLDPDLPIMWLGATQALRSDNPDKIRHFITSLRELFTHVLHILAPDDAFARWDREKAYYDNNKPTRQGRLLFICRNMSGSDAVFAKFMKNDVDSAISLIRMFQGGTHKIKSDYSPQELELILIRAELSLRTFLKVEFDINRR